MEAAQSLYGEAVQPWIESLKQVQSVLGGLEDLQLLEGVLLIDVMPVTHAMLQEQHQTYWPNGILAQWKIHRSSHHQFSHYGCYTTLLQPLQLQPLQLQPLQLQPLQLQPLQQVEMA